MASRTPFRKASEWYDHSRMGEGLCDGVRGPSGRRGTRWSTTSCLLLALLLCPSARGQTSQGEAVQRPDALEGAPSAEGETLFLRYTADGTCPTAASFRERVESLTAHARFTEEEGSASRKLSISVSGSPGHYSGQLQLTDEKTQATRVFEDRECGWVLDALALATALALDPDALDPNAPDPSAAAPPATLAPEQTQPATPPEGPKAGESNAPAGKSPPHPYTLEIFVATRVALLSARSTATKTTVPRPGADVGVAYFIYGESLAASFEASVGWAGAFPEAARLHFVPLARGAVCPLWVSLGTSFRFSPCLGIQAGMVLSKATDAVSSPFPTAGRAYTGAEGLLRAQVLWNRLHIGFQGGLLAPLSEVEYLVVGQDGTEQAVLTLTRGIAPAFGLDLAWAVF